MATKKTPTYNDAAQYRVELAEKIELYGQAFYPGHDLVVRGDVLNTQVDAAKIKSATLVPEA